MKTIKRMFGENPPTPWLAIVLIALSLVLAGCSSSSSSKKDKDDDDAVTPDPITTEKTLKMTPALAACSSCHDASSSKNHMKAVGYSFDDKTQSEIDALGAEACIMCHQAGGIGGGVAEAHDLYGGRVETTLTITNAGIVDNNPTVTFTIDPPIGNIAGTNRLEIVVARLVETNSGYQTWQSYLTRNRQIAAEDAGTEYAELAGMYLLQPSPAVPSSQLGLGAADCAESAPGTGKWTCTLPNLDVTATPPHYGDGITNLWDDVTGKHRLTTAADWDDRTGGGDQTHRVVVYMTGDRAGNVESYHPSGAAFDFRPDGNTVTETKDSVAGAACDSCHDGKVQPGIAAHGSDRRRTAETCSVCHNQFNLFEEVAPFRPVDMVYLGHEIHSGGGLSGEGGYMPEGEAEGISFPWTSNLQYACDACHTDAAGRPERAFEKPTVEACGSCHNDVTFYGAGATHSGGASTNDKCTDCHGIDQKLVLGGVEYVTGPNLAHTDAGRAWAIANDLRYDVMAVDYDANDRTVTVEWQVLSNGTPVAHGADGWDLSAYLLVGWGDADYTNSVGGNRPGGAWTQSNAQNSATHAAGVYTSVVDLSGEPSFTGDETMIAASLSGTAANASHSGMAVATAVDYWGDGTTRRQVADMAGCHSCHAERGPGVFRKHGGNAHSDVERCIICHNNNSTDIQRREQDGRVNPPLGDLGTENPANFMTMIHKIHSADANYTLPGHTATSWNSWADVRYPSQTANCGKCHAGTDYEDFLEGATLENRRGTTVVSGSNRVDVNN